MRLFNPSPEEKDPFQRQRGGTCAKNEFSRISTEKLLLSVCSKKLKGQHIRLFTISWWRHVGLWNSKLWRTQILKARLQSSLGMPRSLWICSRRLESRTMTRGVSSKCWSSSTVSSFVTVVINVKPNLKIWFDKIVTFRQFCRFSVFSTIECLKKLTNVYYSIR